LNKVGVHTDGVGTTALAGAFDVTRPMDEILRLMMQSVINHGYQEFIGKVAQARGKDIKEIDAIARGRGVEWCASQKSGFG
jgi:protease-4